MKFLILALLFFTSTVFAAADYVTTNVISDTKNFYIVHFTGISAGTGEAAVVKVDKSAIGVAEDGAEAASLDIFRVEYAVSGSNSIKILWDHTTDDTALVLSGRGERDFSLNPERGFFNQTKGLKDPRSAGGTGDILLTNPATGGDYDITLWLSKASN